MLRFVFCALVLPLACFAKTPELEKCPKGKKHYRVGIRHIERGGIGYEDGYTTLETFLSQDPSRWAITPFLDAKGHVFDNGKWAINAGVGLRALWKNRAYGINTYYDYRHAGHLNANQIGVGLETLGQLFDFRINGYLPISKKTSAPYDTVFDEFSGNFMYLSQRYKSAMRGANAEFGLHFGKPKQYEFYAAAGPYYFIGKYAHATWGGKARIAGTFKEVLTLEISDSYDRTFRNKCQGQISLNFSFGRKSKVKKEGRTCEVANTLTDRMLQPVDRQEIIVIDKVKRKTVAIDPSTGLPYFFVFVSNAGNSNGSYESPYHSFAQAEANSNPNDIIYVFPGDGTTTGMNSGIALKANQKLWGSGINQLIQTSEGTVSIPAQSSSSPIITNTDISTDGNAVTLATNNSIRGLTIESPLIDAIFGADAQNLEVFSCTFKNTTTYPIEASFSGNASISITNNLFSNNVNGVFLTLNGTSTVLCADNTFTGQTSVSSVPFEISAINNVLTANIKNNVFNANTTGSIRFGLNNVINIDINVLNNTITNNGTGSQASLGSSFVILTTGTVNNCTIVSEDNTFSNNTSNAHYLHTSGAFGTLNITSSNNTTSNNGGSSLVLATPVNSLTLLATDNTITGCNDNGIAVIASGTTTTGNITISNNTITDIGNSSNGIAINQDFSTLSLTLSNNDIERCQGTGILSYAPTGIGSLTLNVSDNTIADCQNMSSNAAPGLDMEQFATLAASITNNTLTGNTGTAVFIGSTLTTPAACVTFTGNNSSTDYILSNPVGGTFRLTPCNADSVNVGMIIPSGTIDLVQSCSNPTPCPP